MQFTILYFPRAAVADYRSVRSGTKSQQSVENMLIIRRLKCSKLSDGRDEFVIRLRMGRSLRETSCKLRHCLSRNGNQCYIVARSGRRSRLSIGSRLSNALRTALESGARIGRLFSARRLTRGSRGAAVGSRRSASRGSGLRPRAPPTP